MSGFNCLLVAVGAAANLTVCKRLELGTVNDGRDEIVSIVHIETGCEKSHPRKIAGYPRLFRDRLPEVDWEAQSHRGPVFRPPLRFEAHVSNDCLCC